MTIDPHDKEKNEASLLLAREWIAKASVIYILGYGFDENNSRRIGLDQVAKQDKSVMFTNFGDLNTVNKKASKLFLGTYGHFVTAATVGHPTKRYFEKSVRDVYEALEKDFEALEGHLHAETKI